MAYDLQQLSVLVVDDNDFSCRLIADVLIALKVGRIKRVSGGAEAIAYLKAGVPGQSPCDVVFTDLMMSPMDGGMLLRWIRLHPESPDRFVPVVIVSGVVDVGRLQQCRDFGATEILAKPFSINGIVSRLTEVLERPRQFVQSFDYFGPDRRRSTQEFAGDDRRTIDKEEVQVVMSGKPRPRKRPGEKGPRVLFYRFTHRLRDKLMGLGGRPGVDPSLIKFATDMLAQRDDDYADWVLGSMAKLQGLLKKLDIEGEARPAIKEINLIAHELRGQGTTFGYPLITLFCQSLYDNSNIDLPLDGVVEDDRIELIRTHLDGVAAVLTAKVKGDGGDIGQDLRETLAAAVRKFQARGM